MQRLVTRPGANLSEAVGPEAAKDVVAVTGGRPNRRNNRGTNTTSKQEKTTVQTQDDDINELYRAFPE
jgi:hypothetical protein